MEHSESLWGIPTTNERPSGLDIRRGRRVRTLTSLGGAESWGTVDQEKVRRAVQADVERFARADRAVARQQARMLAARAQLASAKLTNEAIQTARREMMAARHTRTRLAREACRTRRQAAASGSGEGAR
jgi:hypothetical protein